MDQVWKRKFHFNLFSLPFIGVRQLIKIYFLSPINGSENEFKFIFSPKNTVVKMNI